MQENFGLIFRTLNSFGTDGITSAGFYRCCTPEASAPVVAINQSPSSYVLKC